MTDADKGSYGSFGFGTEYRDETGLIYYGARYYSPALGRFISRDPAGIAGSGVNLYAFCGGDPVNNRELYGLCTGGGGFWGSVGSFFKSIWNGVKDAIKGIRDFFTGDTADQAAKPDSSPNPSAAANSGNSSGYRPVAISADGKNVLVEITDRDKFDKAVQNYKDNHDGEDPVVGEGWKNGKDFYESGGELYDDPNNVVYGSPDASAYNRGGSALGDALARIPILGYLLGPIGDIISGTANLLTGNISDGVSQIGFGLYDFSRATIMDAGAFVMGNVIGKSVAALLTTYDLGKSIVAGNWKDVGQDLRGLVLIAAIPNYGFMGGANWGYDPRLGINNPANIFNPMIELPSNGHDRKLARYESMTSSQQDRTDKGSYHSEWVHGVWSTPGPQPGLYGQFYRIIGTPAFSLFSIIE